MSAPFIHRLTIERYRGIEALTWYPAKGVNVILGGGDGQRHRRSGFPLMALGVEWQGAGRAGS